MDLPIIDISSRVDFNFEMFEQLVQKKTAALIIRKQVSIAEPTFYDTLTDRMSNISKNVILHENLSVYPLTYAVVHEKAREEESEALLNTFLQEGNIANKKYEEIIGEQTIANIELVLKKLTNDNLHLLTLNGQEFPKYNIRRMTPRSSYAIEIHCENAFISQLNKTLREFFYNKVDVENALSFYSVLQKDKGGDLLLFNHTWDDYQVDTSSMDERTRKSKELFFETQKPSDCQRVILEEGDLVIFRAGQIWHCIDEVSGTRPRLTLGGFIAPSLNDKNEFYRWS